MTEQEYEMLTRYINANGLDAGMVVKKVDGLWCVLGEKDSVAAPIIRLPHWTEGRRAVVLDGRNMRDK